METAAPTCRLCSRCFFSAKALYGHMRWHRATALPAAAAAAGGESQQRESPPRGWARTARRTPVLAVAMAAVLETTGLTYVPGAGAEADGESASSAISVDAVDGASKEDVGDSATKFGAGQVDRPPPVSLARPPCDGDWCRKSPAQYHCEAPAAPPPPPAYHCGTCGKSFSSRQALCGHTAIHGKRNGRPEEGGGSCGPAPKRRRVKGPATGPSSDPHRCGQCGRVFGTGQALGGHMRLHWQGPSKVFFPATAPPLPPPPPPPPPPAVKLEENIITNSSPPPPPPVRDFDLNELPPEASAAAEDDGGAREMLLLP